MQHPQQQNAHNLRAYYQFQSKIYDATRWSFLFGRQALVRGLPFEKEAEIQVLEVGCGTGANLLRLAERYPNARILGVDVSADMLKLAAQKTQQHQRRVDLLEGYYGQLPIVRPPHLVVFSYCLTMVNPGWDRLIAQAYQDLVPGGYLAVVDFHYSPLPSFRRHMSGHHVRMEKHLLPVLTEKFTTVRADVHSAYGGAWQYLQYLGKKA
ncbi:MAG: methyltransferase domain-containing protein [Lewinella sp.]|nr:methyltransferase domain-containing protein [Lewinella sp.]